MPQLQGYRGPQVGDQVWIESRQCYANITSFHPTRIGCVRVHPGTGNRAPWVVPLDSLIIVAEGRYETEDGDVVESSVDRSKWQRFLSAIRPSNVTVGGRADVDVFGQRIVKAWFVSLSWSADEIEEE